MANSDWSREEVEVVVTDYFEMLKLQLSGVSFIKAGRRRNIINLLDNRSHKSIDAKHQNISAVLDEFGKPYIVGYKPYRNYQNLLKRVILERLYEIEVLEPLIESYSQQPLSLDHKKISFSSLVVEAPDFSNTLREPPREQYGTRKVNFTEKEQRNKSIGDSGEKLVFEYEKFRLKQLGKPDLVKKLEWVSKDQGDGAGYDIRSKNEDGSDRFIEVKSTTQGIETPIYFSKRENEFAESNPYQFYLYRVFNLRSKPKIFKRQGPFSAYLNIEAQSFKGYF